MATKEAELFVVVGADVGPLKRAYAEAGNQTQVFGKQLKQQAQAIEDAAYEEFAAKQRLIAQSAKEAAARKANMTAAEREAAAIQHSADMTRAAARAGILGSKAVKETAEAVETVARSSGRAGVGLNTLRASMTAMLASSLQTAPGVAQVSSALGTMALGTPVIIGILAGTAAIVTGWRMMTKEAREYKKVTDEAVESIKELLKKQREGVTGKLDIGIQELNDQIAEKQRDIRRIAQFEGEDSQGAAMRAAKRDLAELIALLAAAEKERATIIKDTTKDNVDAYDKQTEGVRKLADAYRDMIEAAKQGAFATSIDPATIIAGRQTKPTASGMAVGNAMTMLGEPKVPVVDRTTAQVVARMQEERAARERQAAQDAISTGNLPPEGERLPLTSGEKATGAIGAAVKSGPVGMIVQAAAAFGPFALLMPVINGLMEKLAPIIEMLMEPLEIIGGLLAVQLKPILKLLMPPLKLLATVSSYVVEGLGGLLKALGKAINWLLPGNPANGLVNLGKEMQAGAKEAREALKNVGKDVEDAGQRMAESMSSVPLRFNAALERYQIATGATGRTASPRSTGGGGVTITGPITIVTDKNDDPRALWDKFMRGAKQAAAAGDPQARAWAAAAARRAFA
jgi:hypothetical protein